MPKRFIISSVIILVLLISIVAAVFLFFLPISREVTSSELVSPVITEPPYNNLFKEDLYTKVNREKTLDNYPPNQYFPTNLEPLYNIDLDLSSSDLAYHLNNLIISLNQFIIVIGFNRSSKINPSVWKYCQYVLVMILPTF